MRPLVPGSSVDEQKDLEEANELDFGLCDSNSDNSDDADAAETTDEDRAFMKETRECSKNSPDQQTKVS